jgi:hypothetical protein
MTEDKTPDEKEPDDGALLPNREMMSLVSTDPADPLYGALIPPPTEEIGGPYSQGLPLPTDPEVEGGSSESTSTTVENSDSASAG